MSNTDSLYGAIEAGGTKFICAVGSSPRSIHASCRIPTTTPDETLGRVQAFFHEHQNALQAIGIGSFGPIDVRTGSPTHGQILQTPKTEWSCTDLGTRIRESVGVPVAIETDVNTSAISEARWGAGRNVDTLLYLTVGTGIGGGYIVNGHCLHGLLHPEMGHIRVPRHPDDDFEGGCPYHGDCLEGLASGAALESRWGTSPKYLPDDHLAWDIEAHYLAHACATFVYTLSPERIILGGGVMNRSPLIPKIRRHLARCLAGYPTLSPLSPNGIDAYLVPPALGQKAGIVGALMLAENLASQANTTPLDAT